MRWPCCLPRWSCRRFEVTHEGGVSPVDRRNREFREYQVLAAAVNALAPGIRVGWLANIPARCPLDQTSDRARAALSALRPSNRRVRASPPRLEVAPPTGLSLSIAEELRHS